MRRNNRYFVAALLGFCLIQCSTASSKWLVISEHDDPSRIDWARFCNPPRYLLESDSGGPTEYAEVQSEAKWDNGEELSGALNPAQATALHDDSTGHVYSVTTLYVTPVRATAQRHINNPC